MRKSVKFSESSIASSRLNGPSFLGLSCRFKEIKDKILVRGLKSVGAGMYM
jgi:hypothetical protein